MVQVSREQKRLPSESQRSCFKTFCTFVSVNYLQKAAQLLKGLSETSRSILTCNLDFLSFVIMRKIIINDRRAHFSGAFVYLAVTGWQERVSAEDISMMTVSENLYSCIQDCWQDRFNWDSWEFAGFDFLYFFIFQRKLSLWWFWRFSFQVSHMLHADKKQV